MAEESPSGGAGPPRRLGRLGKLAPYAVGGLVALGAVFLAGVVAPGPPRLTQRDIDDTVADALASVTPAPPFSEQVYEAVRPSLVLIRTTRPTEDGEPEPDGGLGSGVVVSFAGDILTSLHVVADSSEIEVTFADGTTSRADVVASEPENDIAVVRAIRPPATIVPAILGSSRSVRQGSEAYAMGSPFGLSGSMSVGVISGGAGVPGLPVHEFAV